MYENKKWLDFCFVFLDRRALREVTAGAVTSSICHLLFGLSLHRAGPWPMVHGALSVHGPWCIGYPWSSAHFLSMLYGRLQCQNLVV